MTNAVVALTEPAANPDLKWVEDVAALLPEEERLGWYRNVRPWLRVLPPDDDVAHLAYSMGYLALLTRSTPALIASERAALTTALERLSRETSASVKTTAAYHQELNARLSRLPAEIADGLRPDALADRIVAQVRQQFLGSGIPEAGRLLREEGDRLRELAAEQIRTSSDLRQELIDSGNRARNAWDSALKAADRATKSIDHWNREMCKVQWISLGLTLLIGVLLGAFLYWSALNPPPPRLPQPETPIQQSQPSTIPAGKAGRHAAK